MTSPSEIEDGSAPTPEEYNGFHSSSNTKIVVSNLPPHVRLEDLENLLSPFGHVQKCEKLSLREGQPQVVQISYETQEQAQQAVSELNGCEFEGSNLKVELAMERRGRGGPRPRGPPGGFPGMAGGGGRPTDFPLRILVQSDMVGAIIGRQGTTIRQITQQTRARVDVHRKDNVGSLEKAITIYGNPDNCTNACKKILEVMQQEATNTNKGVSYKAKCAMCMPLKFKNTNGTINIAIQSPHILILTPARRQVVSQLIKEITLKILAHNNLIGRIIGKGGNTIKRIMQDTETKITVSSINDINSFNLERIITVKGSIDNMSRAESMISAKLRQSYENDLQAMAPQSMMFPGLHPMAMMSTSGMGYSGRSGVGYQGGYPAPYPPMYQGGPPPIASGPPGADASDPLYGGYEPPFLSDAEGYDPYCAIEETTYLYIPNNAVGAIIGTKGSHIRNMIRFSGASVKIAPMDENQKDTQQAERKVTIVGSPESQWKAQYLIFEKMREEGFVSGSDDVRLTVEILVPSGQVGRIIGKGGQNVRELQRVTGSIIKLPEQSASPPPQDEDTTVHIIGPFFSVQSAQRRIRSMVVAAGGSGGRTPRGPRQEPQ